jgi:hypothetical protein
MQQHVHVHDWLIARCRCCCGEAGHRGGGRSAGAQWYQNLDPRIRRCPVGHCYRHSFSFNQTVPHRIRSRHFDIVELKWSTDRIHPYPSALHPSRRTTFPGGYIDPAQGTAVLTLPVRAEGGKTGLARVEAEAEWVQDRAAGVVSPKNTKRWLLRHLEVAVDGEVSDE